MRFSILKMKIQLFLFVIFIFFVCLYGVAKADQYVEVSVNTPSGTSGEKVMVNVTLKNIQTLQTVEGISGGELELEFDPEMVKVDKIQRGDIIGENFFFIPNESYSSNSVKVAFASSGNLIKEDGELFRIHFSLKASGTVHTTIKNIILYDQDVKPLAVAQAQPDPDDAAPSDDDEKKDDDEDKEDGKDQEDKSEVSMPGNGSGTPPDGTSPDTDNSEGGTPDDGETPPETSPVETDTPQTHPGTEGSSPDDIGNDENADTSQGESSDKEETATPVNDPTGSQLSWFVLTFIIIALITISGTGYYIYKHLR